MADPKLVEYFQKMMEHIENGGSVSIYQSAGLACWKTQRAVEAEAWLRLHCDTYIPGSKGGVLERDAQPEDSGSPILKGGSHAIRD